MPKKTEGSITKGDRSMTNGKRPNITEIALPKRIRLSQEENSTVARLIRILREPDYWLGAFIDSLLMADTAAHPGDGLSRKEVKKMLEQVDGILSWSDEIERWREQNSPMMRHFGHRFFPDRSDCLAQTVRDDLYDGDFLELTRIWRLDHPEPPKRREFPKGRTQHEEDPDSD
jgi:hypothetical protein